MIDPQLHPYPQLPRIQAGPPPPPPHHHQQHPYYADRGTIPHHQPITLPPPNLPRPFPHDTHTDQAFRRESYDHQPHHDDGTDQPSPDQNGLLTDPNDPKRQRACEACRGLKVRCDQDPEHPDLPCKRCEKAKRQCIITAPTRKRQKKSDNRVAELERKIEALQASIDSRDRIGPSPRDDQSSPVASIHSMSAHAIRSPINDSLSYTRSPADLSAGVGFKRTRSESTSEANKKRYIPPLDRSDSEAGRRAVASIDGCIDGLMDSREADRIFNRYLTHMVVHLPTVAFPPDIRPSEVRREKPILFLSILVAASVGMTDLYKQKTLSQVLTGVFADCIIRDGEKSLELIQALQVATVWYRPPKRYEQMNFYQLSHIAAVMAIDVGMGKKLSRGKSWRIAISSDQMKSAKHVVNPDSLEARRTWLGCYFLCANTSMSLRRPNLIRWNSYMDECIEVLESNAGALPSDKLLCQHVKLQHINEEVGQQFSMDDPSATITITDTHVQYQLKAFERQLSEWTNGVSRAVKNGDLQYCEHVSSLYMHEVALHMNHNIDDFRSPFTEESLKAQGAHPDILSATHSRALSECLSAVHGIFRTFFSFEMDVVRALPIFYFIRIAYAVVVLIKLYFAITAPKSEIGKIINLEDLQVEMNLEKLLQIFSHLHEEDAFRPANRFLLILQKLRDWFQHNKDSKEGSRYNPWAAAVAAAKEVASRSTPVPGGRPAATKRSDSPQVQTAALQAAEARRYDNKTPLHFLSDVATTNSEAALNQPGVSAQGSSVAVSPNSMVPMGQDPSWFPNMSASDLQMVMGGMPMGWDGSLDMGSGFEQAMDMTLGMSDPELNPFFMTADGQFMNNGFAGSSATQPGGNMYYNNNGGGPSAAGPPPPPPRWN